jgi:hypothetical protein
MNMSKYTSTDGKSLCLKCELRIPEGDCTNAISGVHPDDTCPAYKGDMSEIEEITEDGE